MYINRFHSSIVGSFFNHFQKIKPSREERISEIVTRTDFRKDEMIRF